MIEREILAIIKSPHRLDLLTDEFRQGRDIGDLLALLNANSEEIVGVGAWIASEIKVDSANAQLLISRLQQLADHENPSIRFHAIGALFPFLDAADPVANKMLIRWSRDPNEGVRRIAEATLKKMSQK